MKTSERKNKVLIRFFESIRQSMTLYKQKYYLCTGCHFKHKKYNVDLHRNRTKEPTETKKVYGGKRVKIKSDFQIHLNHE